MDAEIDASCPPEKKLKLDSYIPTEQDGRQTTSVIFSLKEGKGALVRALRAFEVRRHTVVTPPSLLHIIIHTVSDKYVKKGLGVWSHA